MNVVYDVEMDFDIVAFSNNSINSRCDNVCWGFEYISIQTVFDRNDPCL